MYQLYYYPNNASLAPHLVLAEMGLEYELKLVDRKSNAQKSAEYLALNPAGRIPTLVDSGRAIFESAAICLHLCDENPGRTIMPVVGDPNRPLFHQWLFYLSNTLQAELMVYYYPEKHTETKDTAVSVKAIQENRITDMLELLDKELEGRDYLVGDDITVCDYFLFMLALWADEFKKPPMAFKNLSRYLRNLAQRDAVKKVCEIENISLADYQ
ncbi:MAG: glutathione S-transferase family protein [Kordiimonas sp.]